MNIVFWSQYRNYNGADESHLVKVFYLTDDELKQLREELKVEHDTYDPNKEVAFKWDKKIKRAPIRPTKCVTITSDYLIFNHWDEPEEGEKEEADHYFGSEVCYDSRTDGTHQG
jgi:hypothetical protein